MNINNLPLFATKRQQHSQHCIDGPACACPQQVLCTAQGTGNDAISLGPLNKYRFAGCCL